MSFFGARRHPGVTPLPVEGRLPGFGSASGWLNSEPLTADDLLGKVVLADFWTYTCINWLRTLAWVRAWHESYRDQGLVVVGVHTPEFWFEHDPENVSRATKEMRVEYPVALDPDYGVWNDFGNRYWPAVYLADAQGRIRYHHFGEGDYDECERAIQMLLRESGVEGLPDELVSVYSRGASRSRPTGRTCSRPRRTSAPSRARGLFPTAARIASAQPVGVRRRMDGRAGARSCPNEPGSRMAFRFHARDVNLVLRLRAREHQCRSTCVSTERRRAAPTVSTSTTPAAGPSPGPASTS